MCQLCGITTPTTNGRWPKPLEHPIADVNFLVTCGHDEFIAFQKTKQSDKKAPTTEKLLDVLRLLASALEELEAGQQAWWTSPGKREQRRRLDEECDQKTLSELHRIDNSTEERIEAISAKLGSFVKWSVGLNGGMSSLEEGMSEEKVSELEKGMKETNISEPEEATKETKM